MNKFVASKILGVSSDATKDQIKKAYRKLAKEHHPDQSVDTEAGDNFIQIKAAYDFLLDMLENKNTYSANSSDTYKEKHSDYNTSSDNTTNSNTNNTYSQDRNTNYHYEQQSQQTHTSNSNSYKTEDTSNTTNGTQNMYEPKYDLGKFIKILPELDYKKIFKALFKKVRIYLYLIVAFMLTLTLLAVFYEPIFIRVITNIKLVFYILSQGVLVLAVSLIYTIFNFRKFNIVKLVFANFVAMLIFIGIKTVISELAYILTALGIIVGIHVFF